VTAHVRARPRQSGGWCCLLARCARSSVLLRRWAWLAERLSGSPRRRATALGACTGPKATYLGGWLGMHAAPAAWAAWACMQLRPLIMLMLMLCGCCALAGAAALSGPPPAPTPRPPAAANGAAVGRRALQGAGYGGGASSEPCSTAGAHLSASSGTLDFFDGHADGDVCSWTITCPPSGGMPMLVFSEFDTDRDHVWVHVFDGAAGAGRVLASLSGSALSTSSFRAEGAP
jgi:hypothetical protein